MATDYTQNRDSFADEYRKAATKNTDLTKDFSSIDMEGRDNESILTPEQVNLVNQERKNIKEDSGQFIDWDKARKTLNLD